MLISLCCLVFLINASAQVKRITIQASGLTCSLCSNAINKSLRSINWVAQVEPNIEESTFELTFTPNADVDFDLLKKKVEDAGFFVAKMVAELEIKQTAIQDDAHLEIQGKMMHFLHVGNKTIEGVVRLQILDKGYVSAKEFKRNARYTKMDCYQTGRMGPCCHQQQQQSLSRIYHVTL